MLFKYSDRCIQNNQELIGYADDHVLYDKFAAGNLDQERNVLDALSSTLDSVKNWMLSNHLKMNDDKTEFVIFGSSRMLPKCMPVISMLVTNIFHRALASNFLECS